MREGDEVNIASQLGHIAIALRRWQRDLQPPSVEILSGTLPAVENGNVCLARVDSQVPRRNGDSYVEELVELEDIKELQRGSYIVFKVHNPAQSYVAGIASMGSRAEAATRLCLLGSISFPIPSRVNARWPDRFDQETDADQDSRLSRF